MTDRPRILILDASVATNGDQAAIYLGRWLSRLDYDAITNRDQLKQWRQLPMIAHQLLICAPLPWRWAPPMAHLIAEIKRKYEGPIIVVSSYFNWTKPLKEMGCHIAKGPALVPPLVGQLLFGEPKPT